MAEKPTKQKQSAFAEQGINATVDQLIDEVCAIYQADDIPWVVGYSGGKDSTAVLQLVLGYAVFAQRRHPVCELV